MLSVYKWTASGSREGVYLTASDGLPEFCLVRSMYSYVRSVRREATVAAYIKLFSLVQKLIENSPFLPYVLLLRARFLSTILKLVAFFLHRMTTRAMVTTVNSVSAIIAITVAMTTPATKDVTSALGGVVVATEDSGKQETVTADNINNVY